MTLPPLMPMHVGLAGRLTCRNVHLCARCSEAEAATRQQSEETAYLGGELHIRQEEVHHVEGFA